MAIPAVDMLDTVVGIGTCSGADTDKFAQFKLTPVRGKVVSAPLIRACLANIECQLIDIVEKHNIVVLQAVAACFDSRRKEKRMFHAVGDGSFIVDGRQTPGRLLANVRSGCVANRLHAIFDIASVNSLKSSTAIPILLTHIVSIFNALFGVWQS